MFVLALAVELDVTLVTHGTVDKVWMIESLCERWRGPAALSLFVQEERVPAFDASKCSSFALNVVRGSGPYPVNRLRNLAVQASNTSHHLASDLDFLPSVGLRLSLRRMLRQERVALVVPAFQRRGGNCKTVARCRAKVEPLAERVPSTFDALVSCLSEKRCQQFQMDNSPGSHSTTDLGTWLRQETLRAIPCFHTKRYEPYVVVPKNESPPFDERFVGYGKNKIQHVSHLRKLGFDFRVIPRHFLIHVPHPRSHDKETWSSDYARHHAVDVLYDTFLKELEIAVPGPPKVGLCKKRSIRE